MMVCTQYGLGDINPNAIFQFKFYSTQFLQYCPSPGTLCTCSNRVDSCPEPTIIGTTDGFVVDLPTLGVKSETKAFLAKYPNFAYKVRAVIVAQLPSPCPNSPRTRPVPAAQIADHTRPHARALCGHERPGLRQPARLPMTDSRYALPRCFRTTSWLAFAALALLLEGPGAALCARRVANARMAKDAAQDAGPAPKAAAAACRRARARARRCLWQPIRCRCRFRRF